MKDNNIFKYNGLTPSFIVNISHEVRTSLNRILGLAQVMLKSQKWSSVSDTPLKKKQQDKDWSNYTALIVEDDPVSSHVIKAMLRNTGINIIHAENGLNAVEQVRFNPQINLALMDMHLPKMNGLETTERILDINPALPVIAQTANGSKEKCFEAGCVDFIRKPLLMGELFSKMSKYLPEKQMVA